MKPCIILELQAYSDEACHLQKQCRQLATMFLHEMQMHFDMMMGNNSILKERYSCICIPNSLVLLCICKFFLSQLFSHSIRHTQFDLNLRNNSIFFAATKNPVLTQICLYSSYLPLRHCAVSISRSLKYSCSRACLAVVLLFGSYRSIFCQ
jgi:hypothetical protein